MVRPMPPRMPFIALLAGAAAVIPAPADAAIVLDRGMAGVELGTFDGRALEILGAPANSQTVRDRNGSLEIRRYFSGPKVKYVATLPDPSDPDRSVTTLVTRRGTERTADGLGVGTHERNLRAKIAGLTCRTDRAGRRRTRFCFTKGVPNEGVIGRDQTVFSISLRSRLVTRVQISRFYD